MITSPSSCVLRSATQYHPHVASWLPSLRSPCTVFVATPCDLALPLYVHPWTTAQLHHVADSLPLWHLPPVYSNDETINHSIPLTSSNQTKLPHDHPVRRHSEKLSQACVIYHLVPEQLRLLSACLWLALHSSQFKVTKTSTQV